MLREAPDSWRSQASVANLEQSHPVGTKSLGQEVGDPLRWNERRGYGSMPMWSFTAPRIRCLQPR